SFGEITPATHIEEPGREVRIGSLDALLILERFPQGAAGNRVEARPNGILGHTAGTTGDRRGLIEDRDRRESAAGHRRSADASPGLVHQRSRRGEVAQALLTFGLEQIKLRQREEGEGTVPRSA